MMVSTSRFGALGSTSPVSKADCPAAGSWETWCDCMYPPAQSAALNGQCRQNRLIAPWTDIGATLRGLPTGNQLLNTVSSAVQSATGSGGSTQTGPVSGGMSSLLTGPIIFAAIGGVALVGGAVLLMRKKRKKS